MSFTIILNNSKATRRDIPTGHPRHDRKKAVENFGTPRRHMRERKFPRSAVDRSKKWDFEPPFQRDTPDRRPAACAQTEIGRLATVVVQLVVGHEMSGQAEPVGLRAPRRELGARRSRAQHPSAVGRSASSSTPD